MSGFSSALPEAKKAACRRLITNPRASRWISIWPLAISSWNRRLSASIDGTNSTAVRCSPIRLPAAASPAFSGAAGPSVRLLEMVFRVPPRSAWITASETCFAVPLWVAAAVYSTTNTANSSVTKSA